MARYDRMERLLKGDLDYHSESSAYASHNFHAFPAKFPPQLPREFILALTDPGETVLDPMAGSGTTLVEAMLNDRQGLGCDIDPLALRICRVKTRLLEPGEVLQQGHEIVRRAREDLDARPEELRASLGAGWSDETRAFVDYWFAAETQLALWALTRRIAALEEPALRAFMELTLSAIIITKSGGVSLALDLAHTRPHRAKIVYDREGNLLVGGDIVGSPTTREAFLTKRLRSPLDDFSKRLVANVEGLPGSGTLPGLMPTGEAPNVIAADAQSLPLSAESVDLIVTSPPYASNAIDYMRAHKFSLVWLGHEISDLGEKRQSYVGGDATTGFDFEALPPFTEGIVTTLSALDAKKALALRRYYSEMTRVLAEMYRVLKPGKSAIVVVGSSIMRGMDTQTQDCLADIGASLGFLQPVIGVRNLDRDRRMMPAMKGGRSTSQIQQRMHEEYVIGLFKPHATLSHR
jgi:DNA modification methylase